MKKTARAATAPLSTGGLCERAGITRGALRTYEALGLIEPTRRSAAGYREYTADAVDRLAVIRSAKAMGLTLQEVRELLPLIEPERYSRATLLALVKKHLARLDAQLLQLNAIRDVLRSVLADPDKLTSPDCDLVAELTCTAVQSKPGKRA
jgi:MerR family transcriptional regulator, copper efflux regulator